jgi:hypothetical protein
MWVFGVHINPSQNQLTYLHLAVSGMGKIGYLLSGTTLSEELNLSKSRKPWPDNIFVEQEQFLALWDNASNC